MNRSMEATTTTASTSSSERKRRRPHVVASCTDTQQSPRTNGTLWSPQRSPPEANDETAADRAAAAEPGDALPVSDDDAEGKASRLPRVVLTDINSAVNGQQATRSLDNSSNDQHERTSSDCDDEDDDVLVVLELADFKHHPIFDDCASIRLEGIDTASPMLHIGEYTLYGQLDETVGTSFFYDTNAPPSGETNKSDGQSGAYTYVGQTTKKIRFTIAPPQDQ